MLRSCYCRRVKKAFRIYDGLFGGGSASIIIDRRRLAFSLASAKLPHLLHTFPRVGEQREQRRMSKARGHTEWHWILNLDSTDRGECDAMWRIPRHSQLVCTDASALDWRDKVSGRWPKDTDPSRLATSSLHHRLPMTAGFCERATKITNSRSRSVLVLENVLIGFIASTSRLASRDQNSLRALCLHGQMHFSSFALTSSLQLRRVLEQLPRRVKISQSPWVTMIVKGLLVATCNSEL